MNDTFWEFVCSGYPLYRAMFGINIVFLVLLSFSFLLVERGSAAFVISALSVGIVVVSLVALAIVIRRCACRQ